MLTGVLEKCTPFFHAIAHITESREMSMISHTLAVFVVLPTLLAVISCGLPPSVNHGIVQNGGTTTFGSNVTVTCKSGYTANGYTVIMECGTGNGTVGNWSFVACVGKLTLHSIWLLDLSMHF